MSTIQSGFLNAGGTTLSVNPISLAQSNRGPKTTDTNHANFMIPYKNLIFDVYHFYHLIDFSTFHTCQRLYSPAITNKNCSQQLQN